MSKAYCAIIFPRKNRVKKGDFYSMQIWDLCTTTIYFGYVLSFVMKFSTLFKLALIMLFIKILFPLTKEEKFGLGNHRYDFF